MNLSRRDKLQNRLEQEVERVGMHQLEMALKIGNFLSTADRALALRGQFCEKMRQHLAVPVAL